MRADPFEWYERLADVPGVNYEPPLAIDRRMLPGHDSRPQRDVYAYDGEKRESWWWPLPDDGVTSASPASEHAAELFAEKSAARILRRLYEALELPGRIADYHYALHSAADALYRLRLEEPQVLSEVERLCWADVRLVEAHPEAVGFDEEGESRFYAIPAFERLILLYEREGYLAEALDVAERAARFEQAHAVRERLAAKLATLRDDGEPSPQRGLT